MHTSMQILIGFMPQSSHQRSIKNIKHLTESCHLRNMKLAFPQIFHLIFLELHLSLWIYLVKICELPL